MGWQCFLWHLLSLRLVYGSVYHLVLKDNDTVFDPVVEFSHFDCSMLQFYRNLAQLNYFAYSLSCQLKPTLNNSRIMNQIKYFERSRELEVAQLEKLHLSPQQPRSDIPDLSQHLDCTVTYDSYKSFKSRIPLAQAIVSPQL
jgi:hypothetical protein